MDGLTDGFWLVSDLHLGHRKVSRLRGFDDVDEHDRVVLGNLRAVPDGATVICRGTSRCVVTPMRCGSWGR
jgi:calcineurin-like phosphoesterase family protein